MNLADSLTRDGFVWLRGAFDASAVESLIEELHRVLTKHTGDCAVLAGSTGPAYGARNLLMLWPECKSWIDRCPDLVLVLRKILGNSAGVVRGLYFDKPPGHSWALPWHRDYTIAVKSHRPALQFSKPTLKAGIPHLEAPTWLLQSMLTIRIHLDPMTNENGALRVVPGSHTHASDATAGSQTLHCLPGDVLIIRPLVLHASGHAEPNTRLHRRIIHLECASHRELPENLEWNDFIPIV